jgi:predicted PurR-regulated permease PerM
MEAMRGVAAAIATTIIIGTLYFGREVFVPIALAILLSFVLAPLVRLLQRWYMPRGLSVISVVLLAFISIFALGGVIATQLAQLAGDLPRYELTMREKIKSLRGTAATSGTLERAADVLQDLGKELNKPKDPATSPTIQPRVPPPGQEPRPIPVEVRQPPPTALESLAALISPVLRPLTTTGITAIFVIFMLLQREDLRSRFIKLAGSHDLQKTTAALDDATTRLSRLFLIQLALNTAFGVVIGTGLWIIGIPSPVLWGILTAVLRFVPYVGAAISAVFPLTLAAAVDPGWAMLLWTAALFLVVEPVVGHVIEPLLYGHSTGMSPVAVITSATFWTALWGPVGLVLATPFLPQVKAPTLVTHCTGDVRVPFALGQEIAAGIPGAKFVPLDSRNHNFLAHEPATRIFFDAVASFLGDPPFRGALPGTATFKERAQRRIAALERNWLIKAVAILAALAGAMISFLQLLRLLRQ